MLLCDIEVYMFLVCSNLKFQYVKAAVQDYYVGDRGMKYLYDLLFYLNMY